MDSEKRATWKKTAGLLTFSFLILDLATYFGYASWTLIFVAIGSFIYSFAIAEKFGWSSPPIWGAVNAIVNPILLGIILYYDPTLLYQWSDKDYSSVWKLVLS